MALPRISGIRGEEVELDVTFLQGGIPTDPFAIRRIEIFRGSVSPENIVGAVDFVDPDDPSYPSPAVRLSEPAEAITSDCPSPCDPAEGADPTSGSFGRFAYNWLIPEASVATDVYFDVWFFHVNDPRDGSNPTDDLSAFDDQLQSQCCRFWVYPSNMSVDCNLQTLRFGFEALDIKFKKPECRPLEVGIMPLPLYDNNFNLNQTILPTLIPRFTIKTQHGEVVVDDQPGTMKLRQGSYRSNPFVASIKLNTCNLFVGTYEYRVTIELPDGSTRTSDDMIFTVS